MKPGQRETIPWAIRRDWVYFFVPADNGVPVVYFSDATSQISNQFVERFILRFGRQIPIKIADEADSNRDIV